MEEVVEVAGPQEDVLVSWRQATDSCKTRIRDEVSIGVWDGWMDGSIRDAWMGGPGHISAVETPCSSRRFMAPSTCSCRNSFERHKIPYAYSPAGPTLHINAVRLCFALPCPDLQAKKDPFKRGFGSFLHSESSHYRSDPIEEAVITLFGHLQETGPGAICATVLECRQLAVVHVKVGV